MTVAEFRDFATDTLPAGGKLQQCRPDGTPFRRPGTIGPIDVASPDAADSETGPDIYWLRFDVVGHNRQVSFLTTDPWTWQPANRCWVIPELDDTGALVGWVRVTPPEGSP